MKPIVVCEIEKTKVLTLLPTPILPGVWRYTIWLDAYEKTLPFMADTDNYPSSHIAFSNLLVDYAAYYKAETLEQCLEYEGSYFLEENIMYVHGSESLPAIMFAIVQYGSLIGFTNTGVRRFNNITYLPEVISVPMISENVDIVDYSVMSMKSSTVELSNFLKLFDNVQEVFGNDFNIKAGNDTGNYLDLKPIIKYYIENYVVSSSRAVFSLKDKRELFSSKVPSKMFDTTKYPYIDEENIDKIIPDAFGTLFGVPGICVNGTAGNVAKVFKFGSIITSVTNIYVYRNEQWEDVTASILSIDNANGTVTLPVSIAHDSGSYSNGLNSIKMDGVFRPETNPGDIIAKILELYGSTPYTESNYLINEFESELGSLPEIGLYMNESNQLSDWIEKIQGGSVVGFELLYEYDKITARLDNPNREISKKIKSVDILNIENVEIDYGATKYASSAKIGYATDQNENKPLYIINNDYKEEVLLIHRKENEYTAESLLATKTNAENKALVILDDQKQIRPIYNGVKLFGAEWMDVRLFDIIQADLSIPGVTPRIPVTRSVVVFGYFDSIPDDYYFDFANSENDTEIIFCGAIGDRKIDLTQRDFAGIVRCQVIGRKTNAENLQVELTLRQRDYSSVYADIMGV